MQHRLLYSSAAYRLIETLDDYPEDYPENLKPKTQKVFPHRDIELVEPFWIEIPFRSEVIRIEIVAGFVCDGGSIPRAVWWVDAPLGYGFVAYLMHDALYMSEITSRELADILMAQVIHLDGKLSTWRKSVIYHAVDLFGGGVWRAHTDEMRAYGRDYVSMSIYHHNTHAALMSQRETSVRI